MSLEFLEPRWVNPYRKRMHEHPGRIFLLEGDSSEEAELAERIAASPQNFIELGSGSGQHLIEIAKRFPRASCWGFELRYKRSVRTVEKAKLAGVDNVFVLRTAAQRLAELFPPRSVAGIYVNFPDPWARPKQWKHRLLGADLVERAAQLLLPGGFLSAKTDHRDYFDSFLPALAADSRFAIVARSNDLQSSPFAAQNIITEFESMFLSQRLPVCYVRAELQSCGRKEAIR